MKLFKKISIALAVLIGVLGYSLLLDRIFYTWSFTRDRYLIYFTKPYSRFMSPDSKFALELYDYKTLDSYMLKCLPRHASAGDYPGIVILRNKNGDILNSCFVESKGDVYNILWENNTVYVPAIIMWDLPSPKFAAHSSNERSTK
jgi:hypothetical protein